MGLFSERLDFSDQHLEAKITAILPVHVIPHLPLCFVQTLDWFWYIQINISSAFREFILPIFITARKTGG